MDAIQNVFGWFGTEDITPLIKQLLHEDKINLREASTLLNVAIWSGSENGRSLSGRDVWLREGTDSILIALALALDIYPFRDPDEMRRVLLHIGKKFPEHTERCRDLIDSRCKQNEGENQ